jgi:hypothetical protein
MYNVQDILSGATIRSLSPTASEAQKKAFIAADPTNVFIFKGYGTTDDMLRSNMKGTDANSTYRIGDKAIFMRYIDDYEGDRLQCTAAIKSVADSQKEGVFVKKMYQTPVDFRKNEDFAKTSTLHAVGKYQIFIRTGPNQGIYSLEQLRRVNPDTVSPTNPNGYQYIKNTNGSYSNVADYAKYSGTFGPGDIPDSCKIGTEFFMTYSVNGGGSYSSLSECVSKEYAYGIPSASPDCTDSNNTDSTATFDATKLI